MHCHLSASALAAMQSALTPLVEFASPEDKQMRQDLSLVGHRGMHMQVRPGTRSKAVLPKMYFIWVG